jgi:sugar lactone lactonase YvrE
MRGGNGDLAFMRQSPFRLCVLLIASAPTISAAQLKEAASFPHRQVTGVAISKSGRVFVNFPNWSDDHTLSVAEVIDGTPKPFPNDEWNKQGAAESHFVCVQSVYVDADDNLWILDPAAPKMQEITKGGPKLIKVDLKTNQVAQSIPFGEDIAPKKSYLNDVRVDPKAGVAFITDSGLGAIVVVDLKTGKARRLLENHKSVKAEPKTKLLIDGRELLDQKKSAPQISSDGIALDVKYDYLYFHALTGRTLYRIKTVYLKDTNLSNEDIEPKIESVIQTPAPDGMLEAPDGSVYLTDIEKNGIVRFDPITNKIETVIEDKRLSWPDTMAWGPNDEIYVTASQIQNMPRFNNGKDVHVEPYKLFKVAK